MAAPATLSLKRLAILTTASLGTVAAFLLLYAFRSVVLVFVAAVALAATIRPLANRMIKLGVPRSLATLLLVLLIFVSLLAFLAISGYALAEELPHAATDFQVRYAQTRATLAEGVPWQQNLAARLPEAESLSDLIARIQWGVAQGQQTGSAPPIEQSLSGEAPDPVSEATPASDAPDAAEGSPEAPALSETEQRAANLLRIIIGTTSSLAALLTQFIVLVFVSLYWSLENEWFERLWISLLPPSRRARARTTWHAVEGSVGTHLRSELLQSGIAFLLLWGGFWAIGIPYPLLLAWLCALAWLIPLVGWLVALLPVLLIGLLISPAVAASASLYMTAIFALLEFLVEPRLDVRRRAGSILGLLVAMVLLEAFGIIGLLVASPIAVAIDAFAKHAFALQPELQSSVQLSAAPIEERLTALRAAMGRTTGEIPPRTRNLYARLQELILRAERSIQ